MQKDLSQPLLRTIPQAAKSLGISRAMLSALPVKNKGPPLSSEVGLFVSRRCSCTDELKNKRASNS
jgi:hypothetical protein